ncbi:MAG: VOC family protein [Defluviitaleaceae bacterium]|nr:VOC family protein [Defluviitaleaceae bacterium]
MSIKFTDVGFVTSDVLRLRAFYQSLFGGTVDGNKMHASLRMDGMGFTFLRHRNAAFYYELADGASNVILTFDVDAEHTRVASLGVEIIYAPKTHPWGARSFQFKDPDGNVLNFRTVAKKS